MKKLLSILILFLSLSLVTTAKTYVSAKSTDIIKSTQQQLYYGIVKGNGQHSTVYIKLNDIYQPYIIKSDYVGCECKLITVDKLITVINYKDIKILDIQDVQNVNEANKCVNCYNNYVQNINNL